MKTGYMPVFYFYGDKMKTIYIPQVGHSVAARRKIKTDGPGNTICGPVTVATNDSCIIVTNRNESYIKAHFLNFNDWEFQFLHLTEEE